MTVRAKSLISLGAILFLVIIIWSLQNQQSISLTEINKELDIEDIKLGMPESEVIRLWGEGEYLPGMGGHGRAYKDKGIVVSFPDDKDNDLYKNVSSLEISNSNCSLFSVKVGGDRKAGVNEIVSKGFKPVEYAQDIFVNGEFSIMMNGQDKIESMNLWFEDRDLRDRVY